MAEEKMGLYVHIPFCSKKCDYCDFVSYSMDTKAQEEYLEALFMEIDALKKNYEDRTFNSLYIGGGTPSAVFEGFILSLTRKIFSSFKFDEDIEFTIEVNPASFTKAKFFEYVQAGVNRISIGVQCLNTKLLANHGRVQSLENVKEAFNMLRAGEYQNVSADVMLGLAGQTYASVKKTVDFLIKNKVKHISIYSLQLEKHTLLYDRVRQKNIKLLSEKDTLNMYKRITDYLEDEGYFRYELSNFCRPGFESRHNKKYWNETDYLGLGVAAHSYIDGYRYYNTKRLDEYIYLLKNNQLPVYKKEYISQATRRTERIMLSLRTIEGLNLQEFKKDFGEDLLVSRAQVINKLIEMQMVEISDGFLKIKPEHFYVSNSIILELI